MRPAFYALERGGWRDYVTLLHWPYTLWNLSYVCIGAALAPEWLPVRLGAGLIAFFLGLGVAAHAFDELQGRPLRTEIPTRVLWALAVGSLAGAVAIGVVAAVAWTPWLLAFVAFGGFMVVAYNLELFGGRIHTDVGFALAWGSFPVLVAYVAQTGDLAPAPVLAAAAAFFISAAQRHLSTPARLVRRRAATVEGAITMADGSVRPIDRQNLLLPLEGALRALSWGMVFLATAWAVARMT